MNCEGDYDRDQQVSVLRTRMLRWMRGIETAMTWRAIRRLQGQQATVSFSTLTLDKQNHCFPQYRESKNSSEFQL
jgi:hypothetical protein